MAFIKSIKLDQDSHILDLGCGYGYFLERLQLEGYLNLSACDRHAPESLRPLIHNISKYSQIDFDSNNLITYRDNTFDAVVCSLVLEHLENPAQMLREMSRITNNTGKIIVSIPNVKNVFERLHFLFTANSRRYPVENQNDRGGHISLMTSWILESLLNRADLKIASVGAGFCLWNNHYWFPGKRFGPSFSHELIYCFSKK